jgi:pimeloyl-ACP methyl ester carboxylesterase
VREEILRPGLERALVGVAHLPEQGAGERWGVVLLNAGLVHRVGPARLWVRLARKLCARGHAVLRLDFSGIGDSPQNALAARFEQSAPLEARAAIDALQEQSGARGFVLIGLCSGAEIAFKCALADPRVRGLVLVNPPRFVEEPSAELVARLERRQAQRYYWRIALRNPASWWKALRGRADLGAMLRALLGRLRRAKGARSNSEATPDALAIRELKARGVRLCAVLSEGDWAQDYLDEILGEQERRAALELKVVPACDHLLTPLAAQESLLRQVEAWSDDWI